MILHQPLTEEVPLLPLTFQSTPHCGQWHTWLGGELVLEVMFILLISVLFIQPAQQSSFLYVNGLLFIHFEKAEFFLKYTVLYIYIYIIQLHFSTLLQIFFFPPIFLWFCLSFKLKS